jgi:hypothetical protein
MCRQKLRNEVPEAGKPLYLAVLIERPTSTPSYDISLLRNRASHVVALAILPRADCSPMHLSTAVALISVGCKQCDRPAARMTIGRIGSAVHRIIYGFNIAGFASALRSITEVAALRICARCRHCLVWSNEHLAARGKTTVEHPISWSIRLDRSCLV